jgi:hypothetical protein
MLTLFRMGFTGSRVKPALSLPASLLKGFEQALLTKVQPLSYLHKTTINWAV